MDGSLVGGEVSMDLLSSGVYPVWDLRGRLLSHAMFRLRNQRSEFIQCGALWPLSCTFKVFR